MLLSYHMENSMFEHLRSQFVTLLFSREHGKNLIIKTIKLSVAKHVTIELIVDTMMNDIFIV
jgi:hypothetical protein